MLAGNRCGPGARHLGLWEQSVEGRSPEVHDGPTAGGGADGLGATGQGPGARTMTWSDEGPTKDIWPCKMRWKKSYVAPTRNVDN